MSRILYDANQDFIDSLISQKKPFVILDKFFRDIGFYNGSIENRQDHNPTYDNDHEIDTRICRIVDFKSRHVGDDSVPELNLQIDPVQDLSEILRGGNFIRQFDDFNILYYFDGFCAYGHEGVDNFYCGGATKKNNSDLKYGDVGSDIRAELIFSLFSDQCEYIELC